MSTLVGFRGRFADGGEDEPFRWVFDADVSGAFVPRGRGASKGMAAGGERFEGVLFKTMGLFALTPHVDTREATLQMLYNILEVRNIKIKNCYRAIKRQKSRRKRR